MSTEGGNNPNLGFLRLPLAAKRRRARPILNSLRRASRIAMVLAPLLAAFAWVLTSPVFAMSGVEVQGTSRVDVDWVKRGAEEFRGRNLVLLDLSAVRQRLLGHDWIRSVEIRKLLPDRLRIAVTEYQPSALLVAGEALYFLDDSGSIIARMGEPAEAAGWLLVKADRSAEAESLRSIRASALELVRLLESERPKSQRVREVEALAPGGFRLQVEGFDFPLLVRSETVLERLQLLDRLLPQLKRFEPIRAVDLRFSRRIVVKPALLERGDSNLG